MKQNIIDEAENVITIIMDIAILNKITSDKLKANFKLKISEEK